jgi:hypothetical protein
MFADQHVAMLHGVKQDQSARNCQCSPSGNNNPYGQSRLNRKKLSRTFAKYAAKSRHFPPYTVGNMSSGATLLSSGRASRGHAMVHAGTVAKPPSAADPRQTRRAVHWHRDFPVTYGRGTRRHLGASRCYLTVCSVYRISLLFEMYVGPRVTWPVSCRHVPE